MAVIRRLPRWMRLLAPLLLVVTSCHTIDENVYAQGPVPLDQLPLREPVTYTVGPLVNQQVETRHGLLGSYFSGANYIYSDPGHNPPIDERLDHQQIDPNVDFSWDGSDTNPVVPGAIDHSDGDPRLPDHWPIWSVVWEGYLDVPNDGTYGLRLHVNNGGWLQMKNPAGGLQTIINCPGGSGFEGDCDATLPLAAARHYIRISYYNNAPSSANAIFSWMPPGGAVFTVVPTTALWTQFSASLANRAMIYVHGTTGDYHKPGFDSLLPVLRSHFGDDRFSPYQYYADKGLPADVGACLPRLLPEFSAPYGYKVTLDSAPYVCDSNDGIAINGILLDADIRVLQHQTHAEKITIMSDSGGGAIVRAYLAYAAAVRSETLAMLDGVFFIQGAQAGSFIPIFDRRMAKQNPLPRQWIVDLAKKLMGHDPSRPAARDLTPGSDLYQFTSRAEAVPTDPHYASIVGDVRVHVSEKILPWTFDRGTFELGDGVMLPGYDDPTVMPPFGGERFLPSVIGKGRSSTQWVLTKDTDLTIDYLDPYSIDRIAKVLALPETHFGIGRGLTKICVATPEGPKILNQALIDAVFSLDPGSPDPDRLGYGNTNETVGCK